MVRIHREECAEIVGGDRIVQLHTGFVPGLGGGFVLLHADPEVVEVAQITGSDSVSPAGRFVKELHGQLLIFGNAEAPHVQHAQIHFCSCKAGGGGELVPVQGTRPIDRNTYASLIEEADLIFRLKISGFSGFLVPVRGLLRILRYSVACKVSRGQFNLLRSVALLSICL
ncbi:hypothetical protein RBB78_00585 [Tunturiibacter empetritectus]